MNTRRTFLASAASVAAVGAVGSAAGQGMSTPPIPPHADAELIAACAAFNAAEIEVRAIFDEPNAIADDDQAERAVAIERGQMADLLDRMAMLQPATPAGIQARAHTLALHNADGAFSFDTDTTTAGRLLGSLLRDAIALGGSVTARTVVLPDAAILDDAALIAACDTFDAAEARVRHLDTLRGDDYDDDAMNAAITDWYAALTDVRAIPARTAGGLQIKAVIARDVLAHALKADGSDDQAQEEHLALTVLREVTQQGAGELWGKLEALGFAPSDPDAELIRICAKHAVNIARYNEHGGDDADYDADNDPLWQVYERTRDLISKARPVTLKGMLAKACAAKMEAAGVGDSGGPEGTMGAIWAWDLMNDLLPMVRAAT